MHQHNLNVSGGNENVKYFTSFGYIDQESFLSLEILITKDTILDQMLIFKLVIN